MSNILILKGIKKPNIHWKQIELGSNIHRWILKMWHWLPKNVKKLQPWMTRKNTSSSGDRLIYPNIILRVESRNTLYAAFFQIGVQYLYKANIIFSLAIRNQNAFQINCHIKKQKQTKPKHCILLVNHRIRE